MLHYDSKLMFTSEKVKDILGDFFNRFEQKYGAEVDSSSMVAVRNYFLSLANDNLDYLSQSRSQFNYMLDKFGAIDPFRSETFDVEKLSRFNIKMKKTECLLTQSNTDLLKAVTAVYSCFVDFLRRGSTGAESATNIYEGDNTEQRSEDTTTTTNDTDEKKGLLDELMRTATDDVVLGLLEKDVDYDDYYSDSVLIRLLHWDKNKLDECSKVTFDLIISVADRYGIDSKQLIDHIRERKRHLPEKESDLAISIQTFVDLRGMDASFSDFLDWSQKKALQFTTAEKSSYNRLFKSHIKKLVDAKQPSEDQTNMFCDLFRCKKYLSPKNIASKSSLDHWSGEKRALLIGNETYKKAIPLKSSINDVNNLEKKLRALDFSVTVGTDLTNDEMDELIITFASQIKAGDLVVFFFAGYGTPLNGECFLLPIDDDRITDDWLYRKRAIDAQYTLGILMKQKPLAAVFLLDCCSSHLKHSVTTSNSGMDSTNLYSLQALPDSLVVCNLATNKMIENADADGHNSIFTAHLLEHISKPDLSIDKIITMVCGEMAKTDKSQAPFQMNLLRDTDVYLTWQVAPVKLSPPQHHNPELEEAMTAQIGESQLGLSRLRLKAQDVEIVTYYAMQNNKTLTTLDLAENSIGDVGAQLLVDFTRNHKTLTELFLTTNRIQEQGAKYLADAIENNKTLQALHLSANRIRDQGAKYLADAIKKNTTLHLLNLTDNKIGAEGARYIAHAITNNRTLVQLYLGCNQIGDSGAKYMADAIQDNNTLTEVFLEENEILSNGLQYLNELKMNKPTLKLNYEQ